MALVRFGEPRKRTKAKKSRSNRDVRGAQLRAALSSSRGERARVHLTFAAIALPHMAANVGHFK
jgi:hypothetical protein